MFCFPGGAFKVKWECIKDLPFNVTLHIRNPLNENKPVKISRDGQELPADVGRALKELFDDPSKIKPPRYWLLL